MGVCFGFVLKTSLDDMEMFPLLLSRIYQYKVVSAPHLEPVSRLGGHKNLGTQPGQLTPPDHRNIPCHMLSCSAHKAGGGEGREDIQSCVCLPKWPLHTIEPCCPGDA